MSASPASQTSKGPPPKARNPVERLLVWGFIAVLLALVAIQGVNTWSHGKAVAALQEKVKAADDTPSAPEVTEADVRHVLGDRQPIRTEQYPSVGASVPASKKLEVYSWFSLLPTRKLELWVHYARKGVKDDGQSTVIDISTDDQTAAPVAAATDTTPGAAGAGGMSGPPPGMTMGPPGGGARGRPGAQPSEGEKNDETKPDEKKPDDDKAEGKKPNSDTEKSDSKPESKPE